MLPDFTRLVSDNLAWIAGFASLVALLVGLKTITKPIVDAFVNRDNRLTEVERSVATVADDMGELKCTSEMLLRGVLLLLDRADGNGELTDCKKQFREHLISHR